MARIMASPRTRRVLSELKPRDENNVKYPSNTPNVMPYVNIIKSRQFAEMLRMRYA